MIVYAIKRIDLDRDIYFREDMFLSGQNYWFSLGNATFYASEHSASYDGIEEYKLKDCKIVKIEIKEVAEV